MEAAAAYRTLTDHLPLVKNQPAALYILNAADRYHSNASGTESKYPSNSGSTFCNQPFLR